MAGARPGGALGRGTGPWRFVVETALTGRALTLPSPDDPGWDRAMSAALEAIGELHERTASTAPAADRRSRWVDRRVAAAAGLAPVVAQRQPGQDLALVAGLERVATDVGAIVDASPLSAGWVHGDYWPANILVDDAGAVTGIVDWDSAEPDELAAHDVFHLVLYARKLRRHEALGATVADLLGGALDVTRARDPGARQSRRGSASDPRRFSTGSASSSRTCAANRASRRRSSGSHRTSAAVVPWL